jgi:putative ATPase
MNAPTKMMKSLGYGVGYEYDHDVEGGVSGQNYFPEGMPRPVFYEPKGLGREGPILDRLKHAAAMRAKRASGEKPD